MRAKQGFALPDPRDRAASGPHARLPVATRRVLLAIDDDEVQGAVGLALRGDGYDVFDLGDELELLDYLDFCATRASPAHPLPDAVVLEMTPDGGDNDEAAQALRVRVERIPVILLMRRNHAGAHDPELAAAAACVLDEPFDVDDIRDALMCLEVAPS